MNDSKIARSGRGGARRGAGRKYGSKNGATIKAQLTKEAMREYVRCYVNEHMQGLLEAQVQHAKGIAHLMYRNERGQWERITDPERLGDIMNLPKERWMIWSKDPSVQAFTDLLNRALDRPAEQHQITGAEGGPILVKWKE